MIWNSEIKEKKKEEIVNPLNDEDDLWPVISAANKKKR